MTASKLIYWLLSEGRLTLVTGLMHSQDRIYLPPLVDFGGKSSHTPEFWLTKFSQKTLHIFMTIHMSTYNLLNFNDKSQRNLCFFFGNLGIIFTSASTQNVPPTENGWFGWVKGHPTANGGRDFWLGDWGLILHWPILLFTDYWCFSVFIYICLCLVNEGHRPGPFHCAANWYVFRRNVLGWCYGVMKLIIGPREQFPCERGQWGTTLRRNVVPQCAVWPLVCCYHRLIEQTWRFEIRFYFQFKTRLYVDFPLYVQI